MANKLDFGVVPQGYDKRWWSRFLGNLKSWSDDISEPIEQNYTTSNVTTDRTIDANSTSTAEVADVLCTLIEDLKTKGILK